MNGGVTRRSKGRVATDSARSPLRGHPAIVAGLALGAVLAAAPALAQPGPSAEIKAGARAAAEQGGGEFKAGHYEKALDLFNRAESLIHAPTHLLMIARSQVALGRLVAAQDSYRRVVREELSPTAPAAFKKARAAAEAELRELEPRIPQINVTVSNPAAKNLAVTMDGQPMPPALVGLLRPVDPGTHVVRATADGLASPEKTITVKEGQKQTVTLDLAPVAATPAKPAVVAPPPVVASPVAPPAPEGNSEGKPNALRIAGFTTLGAGVVGLGVGTAFAVLFKQKRGEADELFDKCGAGCTGKTADQVRALDADANTKGTIGVVGLVAGGALAVAGTVMLVVSRSTPKPASAAVTPWIGPGSAGLAGQF